MLYEVDWAEDGTYRPDEYNSPEKFFNDCLENSKEFDLQLGYFSSATISVLADGFASFISNGGRMRLVINHIVSDEDKNAISKGIHGGVIDCFDLSNFEELKKTFDEYQQQFFECLSYLIYRERIDIRIIKPRNKKGIAHTKSGQFRDGDSTTSFTGSANFTISGLFNNLEEIKIDRSDSVDKMVQKRIESQREEFDSIMKMKKRNLEYLSPDNLVSAIKSNYGDKDMEELLDVERKLKEAKRLKGSLKMEEGEVEYNIAPCFPYPSGPREYQKLAFENWKNNGQKGLFAMATGTGKTITSLNCLLEIYKRFGYYKAIILVPTIALVDQWVDECKKFHFGNIIKVYAKSSSWQKDLGRALLTEKLNRGLGEKTNSYIVISTYASFSRDKVYNELMGLSGKTLLIADEAHNLGAGKTKQRLANIKYQRRIGLSATPERQYDDEGNAIIRDFFGASETYTYEFSMAEAIEKGFLCRYYYYPHLVELNSEEMEKYMALSRKIAQFLDPNTKTFPRDNEELKNLLLLRKRVIHQAEGKLQVFKSIMEDRLKENGSVKYSLIYVPEGNKADDEEYNEFDTSEDTETIHLIDKYTSIVRDLNKYVIVRKFTSDSTDRTQTIDSFAKGEIDVLTSMKCLDEGVDVPRSEFAVFCSSTGNPRQFIQRRGRVLRLHKDKRFAVIHDLVVAPKTDKYSSTFQSEKKLIEGEMKRVRDFLSMAENCHDSIIELNDILTYYNIPFFDNNKI